MAAQRGIFFEIFHGFGIEILAHIRQHHAGSKAVDTNVGRAKLFGKGLGHGDDRAFAGGITHLTGGTDLSPHGGNIDDAPTALLQHAGQDGIDAVIHTVDIDGKHPVPMLFADLGDQAIVGNAGVVDQYIHGRQLLNLCADAGFIRHIAANGRGSGFGADCVGCFVIFFVNEPHTMAQSGKMSDSGSTDTAAASGDQDVHRKTSDTGGFEISIPQGLL